MIALPNLFRRCAVSISLAAALTASAAANARTLDHDVDPANLGKGDWIYFLDAATNKLGGNVPSVTNVASLMAFYKSQGLRFIIVKSGTGAAEFPHEERPQFTRTLVDAAHAAGLKIFAYTRSDGKDVPGEIELAAKGFALGADGFVIDAEEEWESHKLENAHEKAVQLAKGIKDRFPNKFLGHAPFPIISYHRSFPYKEFGLYCDAVMPQAYWKSIGVTPQRMAEWMNDEWNAWHRSLSGSDTNAIKPIAPIAQGWNPSPDKVMAGKEILQFIDALHQFRRPASPTGYKGISYWRTDLHTPRMWKEIRRGEIGDTTALATALSEPGDAEEPAPSPPVVAARPPTIAVAPKPAPQPPPHVNTKDDMVLDNKGANVTFTGAWYAGKMPDGRYGSDYMCANASEKEATAMAIYRPEFQESGEYDVFIWYSSHRNRSRQVPITVSFDGGREIVKVDQTINGGAWHLIAREKPFQAGSGGFVIISNDTGEPATAVVIADAVRFVRSTKARTTAGQ